MSAAAGDKSQIAVQPGGEAAAPSRPQPPAWLRPAVLKVRAEGVDAALLWLRAVHKSGQAGQLSWPACVQTLGKALFTPNPEAALRLLEPLLSTPEIKMSAHVMVGMLQDKLGRRAEARETMLAVIRSERSLPLDVLQAANLLVRLNEQALAMEAAIKAFDEMGRPIQHAATLLYIAQVTANWPLVDQLTAQLREGYADGQLKRINESPRTHILWCDDEALNLEVVELWSKRNLAEPIAKAPPAKSSRGRKLRIGYLSSDFRNHPTSRLIMGVLRNHDRSQVELFMYCSGWDDGSDLRKSIEAQFGHVHTVANLSDEAAAKLIRSHDIDVLIELNGPTRAHRMGILRYRPAPVQIDYLGWPGSVGGRVVDYVIGDPFTVPDGAETLYPEKVIRLYPTYQANDHAAQRRPPKPTREQVNLPADPAIRVLGMFNAINKVHQAVWDAWARILQAAPDTVLWMLDSGPVARQHIEAAAEVAGIATDRLIFAPRLAQQAHMARLQCCDLILDPWPYGGHTSTADALFAGVPVLALEGGNFAGRVSTGLLRASGLEILVATTPEEYVERALQLLRDPKVLHQLQSGLRQQVWQGGVFNAASRARQIEQACRVAVERAAQKLPSLHIRVRQPPPAREAAAQ